MNFKVSFSVDAVRMAAPLSALAWTIPWTEASVGCSPGSRRGGRD